jgi:hypothetical protein
VELIAGKEAGSASVLCADDSVGAGAGVEVGNDADADDNDANFDADTDGEVWEES